MSAMSSMTRTADTKRRRSHLWPMKRARSTLWLGPNLRLKMKQKALLPAQDRNVRTAGVPVTRQVC